MNKPIKHKNKGFTVLLILFTMLPKNLVPITISPTLNLKLSANRFETICDKKIIHESTELKRNTYISNLDSILNQIDTNFKTYQFSRYKTKKIKSQHYHIQGVAYYNNSKIDNEGYYFITRSINKQPYDEQLLIVEEKQSRVVKKLKLDDKLYHPSGIQIYDTILVIPFNKDSTKFYSISNPIEPKYLNSIPYMGECAGITKYKGNYLIALSGSDYSRNIIRFILLDNSLSILKDNANKPQTISWNVLNQDKNNWTPYKNWQGTYQHYENMSLIREINNHTTSEQLYLIMYHNKPEAIDIYTLNELDFTHEPNIEMIRRIPVKCPSLKKTNGFRAGGGMFIKNAEDIVFFSIDKKIHNKINIYKYTKR